MEQESPTKPDEFKNTRLSMWVAKGAVFVLCMTAAYLDIPETGTIFTIGIVIIGGGSALQSGIANKWGKK